MKIIAMSDLHGYIPTPNEIRSHNPDIIVIAGDSSPFSNHSCDFQMHWFETVFNPWLRALDTPIIGIGGNHDFVLERNPDWAQTLNWLYFDKNGIKYEGLEFWGAGYVPNLPSWAFHKTENELWQIYKNIPPSVDILITHGPPLGVLDDTSYTHVGSQALDHWYAETNPDIKAHIFGHIHEGYGSLGHFHNVAIMNRSYEPVNPLTVIEV